MKKRAIKKGRKIQFNFNNRFLYTFIAAVVIISLGIVVYALAPGQTPNPGHNIDQLGAPSTCSPNQVLSWNGTNWKCADSASGGGPAGYDFFSVGQTGRYIKDNALIQTGCFGGGPAWHNGQVRNNGGVLQVRAYWESPPGTIYCDSGWVTGVTGDSAKANCPGYSPTTEANISIDGVILIGKEFGSTTCSASKTWMQ